MLSKSETFFGAYFITNFFCPFPTIANVGGVFEFLELANIKEFDLDLCWLVYSFPLWSIDFLILIMNHFNLQF